MHNVACLSWLCPICGSLPGMTTACRSPLNGHRTNWCTLQVGLDIWELPQEVVSDLHPPHQVAQ